jgi:hypothetical protein
MMIDTSAQWGSDSQGIVGRPRGAKAAQLAVDEHRDAHASRDLDRDGRGGKDELVAQRLLEKRACEGLLVIVEANERRRGRAFWRWQERSAAEGVDGLLRDKTRPSRIPKLDPSITERVVALTMEEPSGETTHWTSAAMADEAGVSLSSAAHLAGSRAPAASGPAVQTVQ